MTVLCNRPSAISIDNETVIYILFSWPY